MKVYFAERAMKRRQRQLEVEFGRGLWMMRGSMTCVGLSGWLLAQQAFLFPGCVGSKSACQAAIVLHVAEHLGWGILGLALAILIKLSLHYFEEGAADLAHEMSLAPAMLNDLRASTSSRG